MSEVVLRIYSIVRGEGLFPTSGTAEISLPRINTTVFQERAKIVLKRLYKGSFIYHFQKVLNSPIE